MGGGLDHLASWCGGRRHGRVVGWACCWASSSLGRLGSSLLLSACLVCARCESLGIGLSCAPARALMCEWLGVVLDVMGGWTAGNNSRVIGCGRLWRGCCCCWPAVPRLLLACAGGALGGLAGDLHANTHSRATWRLLQRLAGGSRAPVLRGTRVCLSGVRMCVSSGLYTYFFVLIRYPHGVSAARRP